MKPKYTMDKNLYYLSGNLIRIFPTDAQCSIILKYMKMVRDVYNWGIETQENAYKNYIANDRQGIRIYLESELKSIYIDTINTDPRYYYYLKELPSHIASLTLTHVIDAYDKFFDDRFRNGHPRFKTNQYHYMRYSVRNDNCYIIDGKLKVEGFGRDQFINVKTHKYDGIGKSSAGYISDKEILMYQPTISYDGDNFWFGFSYIKPKEYLDGPKTDVIGIDLGNRNTFTLSTGEVFHQPDCSKERKKIAKLDEKIKHLNNVRTSKILNSGNYICKSNNQLKLEKQRRKAYRNIHNKRFYFYHNITTEIVKRNPKCICIEKLGVVDMMRDYPFLTNIISDTYYFNIRKMFEYKCNKYGVLLIEANENYPSSKTCHQCGFIYDKLGSKHTFKCPYCDGIFDRDFNAAMNLKYLYEEYKRGDYSNISFDWLSGISF